VPRLPGSLTRPAAPAPLRARPVFIATLLASALLHAALALPSGFWAFLALAAASEAVGAPVTLLADAAVMANAEEVGREREEAGPAAVFTGGGL
jgi:hypothetical protein